MVKRYNKTIQMQMDIILSNYIIFNISTSEVYLWLKKNKKIIKQYNILL